MSGRLVGQVDCTVSAAVDDVEKRRLSMVAVRRNSGSCVERGERNCERSLESIQNILNACNLARQPSAHKRSYDLKVARQSSTTEECNFEKMFVVKARS